MGLGGSGMKTGDPQWGLIRRGAAGGAVGRSVEQRGVPSLMLPPEQQILHEEEVRTPPRREAHGHGSRLATEHQLPPGGTRVVPQLFTDVQADEYR